MKPYGKTENLFARDPDTHLLTDELRVPEVGLIAHDAWIATEKIDGTNVRVIWTPDFRYTSPDMLQEPLCTGQGKLEIRGRSDRANLPSGMAADPDSPQHDVLTDRFFEAASNLNLPADVGICLYGEAYGPGIGKGGGAYRADKHIRIFDVATYQVGHAIDGTLAPSSTLRWFGYAEMMDTCAALGYETAPRYCAGGSLQDFVNGCIAGIPSLVAQEDGGDPYCEAEGVVIRTDPYLYHGRNRSRLIAKIKTADLQRSA